jgi:hypothetical protein
VATNPLQALKSLFIDRVTYLLSNSTTCLYILNCTLAQVRGYISLFIVSSGFRKLGGFTGARGGQHRRVSLYIRSHFSCILNMSTLFHRSCWTQNTSPDVVFTYMKLHDMYGTLSFLLSVPLSWLQVTYSREDSSFRFGEDDSLLIPEKR